MATDGQARAHTVTALRRPPVRQSTVVRSDVGHTFDTFVRTIGVWWPVTPFSAGRDRVRDVTFERRLGGRVYETWADGTQVDWGTLRAWEPPERLDMNWRMTSVATEVELPVPRRSARRLTRVAVEHRGWEALTEEQLGCGLRAARRLCRGGSFDRGWARILSPRLAAAVDDGRTGG